MPPANSFRILAVDDEPDIRFLLESALADAYEVLTAADGEEALAKVPLAQPDLIILDLMMPKMDGWEVLVRLRQEISSAKTPVILLSALNQKEDMKRGYQYGASVYLTKPFEVERLRRNIALMFEGKAPGPKKHSIEAVRSGRTDSSEAINPTAEPAEIPPTAKPADFVQRRTTSSDLVQTRGVLPKAPAPSARPGAPGARTPSQLVQGIRPASQAGERPRALIVESDAELLEVIRTIVDHECDTFICKDAAEGMTQIQSVEPDLLVIAGRMPRVSGYQLLDQMRHDPVIAAIPVIFITEKDVYRERLVLQTRGVKHVVGKPLRPHEFTQIVHEVLRDANFVLREKSQPVAELLLSAGKRKAVIEQKMLGRPSRESVNALGGFLRENTKKE